MISAMTPATVGISPGMSESGLSGMKNENPQELARQFEGLFVSMLVKEMRSSSSGEGLFPGDNSDTYGGMFDQYIGQYIADHGGIGLSEFISASLAKQAGTDL